MAVWMLGDVRGLVMPGGVLDPSITSEEPESDSRDRHDGGFRVKCSAVVK